MAKTRVFQIAKELNISHTDILNYLKSKNVEISSHMSPVDEEIHKMIMDEFAKDKEEVDRFRKERVRREIHDTRLRAQQQTTKKLKLLSLSDQRELERKEVEKKEIEKRSELDKLNREGQLKSSELVQEIGQNEKKEANKSSKVAVPSSNKKAKELKKKFKSQKKLRSINLSNIKPEFKSVSKKSTKEPKNKRY